MTNLEVMENLTEGTFVKITGMEVKNDNDIFVVSCDYRINGKYAICKNERCLKKVKLNGELSTIKYNIVFLNDKTFKNNPNATIEIVTDLKAAKKDVNNWLKGLTEEEIIVTYEKAQDQTIKEQSIIRFTKGLTFGMFGEKYISKDSIFVVAGCNNSLWIQRLGQKGQVLSLLNSDNSYNFSEKLYNIAVNENYIEVVEKIETKKGEVKKDIVTETLEENNEENIIVESQMQPTITEQEPSIPVIEKAKENNITIGEYTISEDIDTRDNSKVWILKLVNRVDKEGFNRVNIIIKGLGGYYSRFKGGFLFKFNPVEKLGINQDTITVRQEQQTTYTYPEIDINDIENYKVSQELSKRENSVSMFRRNGTDHNKEIQSIMQNFNDMIMEALQGNSSPYIEYKAKEGLQRYKKKYYDIYIRMLTHKANNPSWAVTGRGGLNVNRYNKKASQYEKMLGESVQISKDFEKHVSKIKNMVRTENNKNLKAEIEQNINSIKELPKFKKIKVKINAGATDNIFKCGSLEVTANELDSYFIIKNWGCWRVYNSKGNEIYQTKTTGNLKEAQQWLVYHLSKLDITA